MMRSTNVSPAGFVWSKKPSLTMSTEWPSADFCSLTLAFRVGRPAWARIWLCRQRIAAATTGRLSAVGATSVLAQGAAATLVLAFLALLAWALSLAGRLSPRAIVAIGSFFLALWAASATGVATRRPAPITATGRRRLKIL